MIKNIDVNELVFSDLFVKKPVQEVNDKLTGDDIRGKFILAGGRGAGKSTVLASREIDSYKTEYPAFLTRFDGAGMFGTKDNDIFNKNVMMHYYEIMMCKKFLSYVKKFYPDLYYARFTKFDNVTNNKLREIDNYINNAMYRKMTIDHKLFSGEMLSEMVSLFRYGTDAKSLTLMIDRFDWTHNSDPRVQDILKNYFSMFEKVIVTSDDPTITDRRKKEGLSDRGFEIVTVDYGKDFESVVDIVDRRFEFDENDTIRFPLDCLNDSDFLALIDKCEGNLETILDSFQYAETLYKWDSNRHCYELLNSACCQKVKDVKQYRKMCKQPKLHL